MRRDQLEHAIRTACQITGLTEVIIVGSQAILGTYTEDQLPFYATRSVEVDVLPITDDTGEIARLADELEGAAGEFSPFEQLHGFSIDGVDLQTSALPDGWRDRLVRSRTRTPPPHRANLISSDGASTRKTCVSRSCVPCERRTRTSSTH